MPNLELVLFRVCRLNLIAQFIFFAESRLVIKKGKKKLIDFKTVSFTKNSSSSNIVVVLLVIGTKLPFSVLRTQETNRQTLCLIMRKCTPIGISELAL